MCVLIQLFFFAVSSCRLWLEACGGDLGEMGVIASDFQAIICTRLFYQPCFFIDLFVSFLKHCHLSPAHWYACGDS